MSMTGALLGTIVGGKNIGFVAALATLCIVMLAIPVALLRRWHRRWCVRAVAAGYSRLRPYLNSVPRTDMEKRDAIDLTLQGLMICLVGIVMPPLLILGVFPLYYGARKLLMAWMGLEILDEPSRMSNESHGEPASSDFKP
jgi:hypothetical protein